ncbi:MAG: tetratricopeptide repeat protein [Candidatus Marinimicrobia bacterium]|nr:tetratricopeptide repeat protein [Candidatus Neomarinimicrobiota bacterium]
MFLTNRRYILLLSVLSLVMWGCPSHEYSTAKMAIQNEDWAQAEEYLFKALVVEPDNPEVMIQIGYHIHAKKREWEKMNEMFDGAMALDPEKKILQSNRPVREMVKNYRSMFWANNYNNAVRKFNDYKSNPDKALLTEAAKIFEETTLIDATEGQTYSILASCYYEMGESGKAIESARKATEMMPDDFQANLALGQILSVTGDKKIALGYVKKAVELDPSNTQAIRQLATIYYDLDDKEKSVETFEAAIKTESDKMRKSDLYFNLGVLNMQLDNFQDAEDAFMYAFDLNPDDTEALVGMAQTFENAEKWRRAGKFYRELIGMEPDNPDHYKGMSRVLLKQGDPEGATRYYEKAKKLGG